MDELLEQMLTSELLNENTKSELAEAFKSEVEKAKNAAREVAITEAKVEFAAQFAEDKAVLVEAIDTKVTALLNAEVAELKEDIERFRDLEAEYAAKLVEEKEAMGLQLKADMTKLVETLDVFLEERLTEEITELKESIEEVKKIEYAKTLFESIEDTFRKKFFDESAIARKLEESAVELQKVTNDRNKWKTNSDKLSREQKMAGVLSPLQGRPREIMEAILKSVSTDKLDESYDNFIGRVLHESASVVENRSEKENVNTSVLAESDTTKSSSPKTVIVNGDVPVVEHVQVSGSPGLSDAERARLRRIAGIED